MQAVLRPAFRRSPEGRILDAVMIYKRAALNYKFVSDPKNPNGSI